MEKRNAVEKRKEKKMLKKKNLGNESPMGNKAHEINPILLNQEKYCNIESVTTYFDRTSHLNYIVR